MKNKFDLIFGIGEVCSCTEVLRACRLQFYSYPFDWLYGSDIQTRVNFLTNDFKDWINKEDLEHTGKRENPQPRDIYYNKKTDITFNHDFPINTSLDESYQEVYKKYERRIDRLFKQIDKSQKILLVYIQAPNNRSEIDDAILAALHNQITKRFRNKNINLLYLFNDRKTSIIDKKIIKINDFVTKLVFDYDAYNKELPYVVNMKKLKSIMNTYDLTGKNLSIKNLFKRFIYKIKLLLKGKKYEK